MESTIQIKSYFGGWKTVEREQAKSFIRKMIDGGCVRREIDGNYLRGISVDELLSIPRKLPKEKDISVIDNSEVPIVINIEQQKPINQDEKEIKDCTVEIEMLARKEAFYRFAQNILFSLTVWQNDEKIRNCLPPVTEWLNDCIIELNKMVNIKNRPLGL